MRISHTLLRNLLPVLLMIAGTAESVAAVYRLEAEAMQTAEGWNTGVGRDHSMKKVKVATKKGAVLSGEYKLDAPGLYNVFVRTMSLGENWRIGRLTINGQSAGTFSDDPLTDGRKKGVWYWKKLTALQLPQGKIAVRVESLNGFTRLDCILLTDDSSYQPPVKISDIEKIRLLPSFSVPVSSLLPAPKGQGEHILLMHGSRPWVGQSTQSMLVQSGCKVTLLDSTYLDGMGGASIKVFLTDLVEPKAKDGITPALNQLHAYKAVAITAIPAPLQHRIFTPQRIALLKKYIREGGNLLVNCNVPASFGDLLPVTLGPWQKNSPDYQLTRPAHPLFSCLPQTWNSLSGFRKVTLRGKAEILIPITDCNNSQVGIFAAWHNYGKGKVLFFNEDWVRKQGMRQLFTWAYGKALFSALTGYAGDLKLQPAKTLYPMPAHPQVKHHDKLELTLEQPVLDFKEDSGRAVLRKSAGGQSLTLPNGIIMNISPQGELAIRYPEAARPYVTGMTPPSLTFSGKLLEVDQATAEAVTKNQKSKTLSGKWKFVSASVSREGNGLLSYENEDGTLLNWEFRSGSLQLNGRKFLAFADRVTIPRSGHMIEALKFHSKYATGPDTAGHYTRRMSCYSPPRGYVEFDLSGKKKADTWSWGLRSSGQPFTWIVSPAGIYSEFVLEPVSSCSARITIGKGDDRISCRFGLTAGYRRAPVVMPFIWHAFSRGQEQGNNDWMTMYQFIRKYLRRKAGLKEFAPVPTATWQNVCTPQEIDTAMKTAQELGFRRMALPWCPSAIEHIDSPKALQVFKKVESHGMMPFPWSAGDYCHGDSEEIFRNHKDWFVRKLDGSIYAYMNVHPVLDLNNRNFQKWYFGKMENAIRNGMKSIYFDMYGAAWGNINYGLKEADPCCRGAAEIFRFFSDRNIMVGIEGQNPLVVDNYWFRQKVYQSFQGKEFAMVCSSPSTGTAGDDLALDYFRTSMYGAFMYINVDGFARKFERNIGEYEEIARIGRLNPRINAAQALVGFPFIQETPFGTYWISPRGGALFFYDSVAQLKLNLPRGWTAENARNGILKNVKNDSIILLHPAGR